MKLPIRRMPAWSLAAAAAILPVSAATAAGFQLREGSPDWVANAFAGIAAKAYDAGTAWTNPAGMAFVDMDGTTGGKTAEIDSALTLFLPSIRFSGENIVGATPTFGSHGGDAAPPQWTGGFEGLWRYSPKLSFGVAAEVPFGLSTVYSNDFVGRYQALVSSIADYEVFLSAAYQINQNFSIGGGPVIDYYHVRLTSAINTGSTSLLTGDPVADIRGNSVSAGYHLGGMYQTKDRLRQGDVLRIGIDYRSRIGVGVSGKQSVFVPQLIQAASPTTAALLAAANSDVVTRTTVPDVLTLGLYYQISDEWAAMATLQWTHWSLLQQATIVAVSGQVQRLDLGFRSTWFGSLGVNYRPRWRPELMLQAGVGFDESPVSDALRSPRLPDTNRVPLSIGFTYDFIQNVLSMQGAYLHEFAVGGASSDFSSGPTAGTLIGKYTTSAELVSFGTKLRF